MAHAEVPLRVSQLSAACAFCKGRKIRCDGNQNGCGGCRKYGRLASCSLLSSHLQDRDYVTYLEKRIWSLRQSLNNGGQDQTTVGLPSPGYTHPGQAYGISGARSIDQLISEIGALPILTASESASGPSLGDVALFAAGFFESPRARSKIAASPDEVMPDKSLAQKLINHYLTSIYPRIPFFSVQGLWNQFELAYSSSSVDPTASLSAFTQTYPATPYVSATGLGEDVVGATVMERGYALFTVLMVLSISTASLSKSSDSLASYNGEKLFNLALQFREFALIPGTIIGVQSILFLIQYATLNPSRLDGWYLIGVGVRLCLDLGLQHDPEPTEIALDHSLLETRRRLFWSMYSFDRSISLGLGRPIELVDDAISAALPDFRIGSDFSEEDITIYRQRYTILHLQSIAYERLWFPIETITSYDVDELCTRFDQWRIQNPPVIVATDRASELLESEWLQARMLIYRPCKALKQRTPGDLLKLWSASVAFVRIYKTLAKRNGIFYIQVACEKVYAAGLNILYAFWYLSHHQSICGTIDPSDLWSSIANVNYVMETLSCRWEEGGALAKKFEDISKQVLHAEGKAEAHPSQSVRSDLTSQTPVSELSRQSASELPLPIELRELWRHPKPRLASLKDPRIIDEHQDMRALLHTFDKT